MGKDHPVLDVLDEKELQNTGTREKPFWARKGNTRWIWLLGLLIFRHKTKSNFPDPSDKL
jgi:hypothetical protein